MNTVTKILLALALVFAASACDKGAEGNAEASTTETAAAEAPEEPAEEPAEGEGEEGATDEAATIEVPAAGQKFDPPVKPEQIPAGAWYCDMGTVEWAAMEKPEDGKCPVCGMMLKQKPGGADEGAAAGDGHGHDHDGHDHDHDGHDHAH